MKKLILILTIGILLLSCNTQRNLQSNDITHVLAINERGDTIEVSMRELRREFRNEYRPNQYDNWQFIWGSNWYWGNVWYPYYFIPHQYSYRYHYWDNWYWRNNPVIINPPRQSAPPRPIQPPRTNLPRVTPTTPRRYTPSTPPRQITPQQPRTTPTQPRTPIREVNPSRGNSNGSPVIRQQPARSSTPTRGGVRKN